MWRSRLRNLDIVEVVVLARSQYVPHCCSARWRNLLCQIAITFPIRWLALASACSRRNAKQTVCCDQTARARSTTSEPARPECATRRHTRRAREQLEVTLHMRRRRSCNASVQRRGEKRTSKTGRTTVGTGPSRQNVLTLQTPTPVQRSPHHTPPLTVPRADPISPRHSLTTRTNPGQ